MEIISISLDGETLKELNEIQSSLGFTSRSKMLRSTIDYLLTEYRILDTIKGEREVIFVVTYKEPEKDHVSDILHEFKDAITMTIHQHRRALGVDILNVDADAGTIRRLFSALKRSKCVRSINFSLVGAGSAPSTL